MKRRDMSEMLLVRLFVQTQTYDIPCDPNEAAIWLLEQAQIIQSRLSHNDENKLNALYNRTKRTHINLDEAICNQVSNMDVVDARLVADSAYQSTTFPWFRPTSGNPVVLDPHISDGLFFQQLYAFSLIGQHNNRPDNMVRKDHFQQKFLNLLQVYISGSYNSDFQNIRCGQISCIQCDEYIARCSCRIEVESDKTVLRSIYNRTQDFPSSKARSSMSPERDCTTFSDSGSDALEENFFSHLKVGSQNSVTSSSNRGIKKLLLENPLDEMENVFDIVFKQQSIGMKLGSDETKQYAVVKECFEGSEAKRYPEIQNGVVILAVNGQEVNGLGLSRILYRLREAPRPVVVRFGRISRSMDNPKGTWG